LASVAHTKILFVGDMHLGKRPLAPELEASQISITAASLGPNVVWDAIVDRAIAEKVNALALAGDLIDGDEDLFEGRALLERGIKKLTEAGIEVCAVAGNHDTRVMPILAKSIPELKLLGPQGQWSQYTVCGEGAAVCLVGWSFPAKHHTTSPLATPPPVAKTDVVTFGLMHCDLGSKRSKYAPVSIEELNKTEYQAWFLGHIHQPGKVPDFSQLPASPFYLGSITGINRNETGTHGPVLVSVAKDGVISGHRIPLAALHWDFLNVNIDSVFTGNENVPWETKLRNHLMAVLDDLPHWHNPDLEHIKALGLSINLSGEVAEPFQVVQATEKLQKSDTPLAFATEGGAVFIRKLTCSVRGVVDLAGLAEREDPPGLLARQILVLENPHGSFSWAGDSRADARRLISLGRKELQRVEHEASAATILPDRTELDDVTIAKMMVNTGRRLLDGLLEQGRSNNATS